jgi:serine/threonine-protein kinase RsbW
MTTPEEDLPHMPVTASGRAASPDVVDLRVPADPAYLAVVRSTTAGLAARLDLTLDEIEDMRIAVDEACALVMSRRSQPGASLHAAFTVGNDTLEVVVDGPARSLPERGNFAWSVLEALVGTVETGLGRGGSWIRLTQPAGRR